MFLSTQCRPERELPVDLYIDGLPGVRADDRLAATVLVVILQAHHHRKAGDENCAKEEKHDGENSKGQHKAPAGRGGSPEAFVSPLSQGFSDAAHRGV